MLLFLPVPGPCMAEPRFGQARKPELVRGTVTGGCIITVTVLRLTQWARPPRGSHAGPLGPGQCQCCGGICHGHGVRVPARRRAAPASLRLADGPHRCRRRRSLMIGPQPRRPRRRRPGPLGSVTVIVT